MQQLGLVEDRDDLVKELNAKKKEKAQQGRQERTRRMSRSSDDQDE